MSSGILYFKLKQLLEILEMTMGITKTGARNNSCKYGLSVSKYSQLFQRVILSLNISAWGGWGGWGTSQ